MASKTTNPKTNGAVGKEQRPTEKASAKLAGVANMVGYAARDAQQQLAKKASQSGHRLHETAQKVGHTARQLATGALHSAQEAAQKVVDRAKEIATTAEHRGEELTGKPASTQKAR